MRRSALAPLLALLLAAPAFAGEASERVLGFYHYPQRVLWEIEGAEDADAGALARMTPAAQAELMRRLGEQLDRQLPAATLQAFNAFQDSEVGRQAAALFRTHRDPEDFAAAFAAQPEAVRSEQEAFHRGPAATAVREALASPEVRAVIDVYAAELDCADALATAPGDFAALQAVGLCGAAPPVAAPADAEAAVDVLGFVHAGAHFVRSIERVAAAVDTEDAELAALARTVIAEDYRAADFTSRVAAALAALMPAGELVRLQHFAATPAGARVSAALAADVDDGTLYDALRSVDDATWGRAGAASGSLPWRQLTTFFASAEYAAASLGWFSERICTRATADHPAVLARLRERGQCGGVVPATTD